MQDILFTEHERSARAGVKDTEIILGVPRVPTTMALGHTQPHLQLIPRSAWVKLPGRDVNQSGSSIFKGCSYRHTPTIRLPVIDKEILTFLCQ